MVHKCTLFRCFAILSTKYSETCLFWSPLGQNLLTLLIKAGGCIRQITLYTNDTVRDFYNGQFRQVTLLYSDLIRQVSLYCTVQLKLLSFRNTQNIFKDA